MTQIVLKQEISLDKLDETLKTHDTFLISGGSKEAHKRIKPAAWAILEEIREVCQKHFDYKEGLRGESLYFRYSSTKGIVNIFMVVLIYSMMMTTSAHDKSDCPQYFTCNFVCIMITSLVIPMTLVKRSPFDRCKSYHFSYLVVSVVPVVSCQRCSWGRLLCSPVYMILQIHTSRTKTLLLICLFTIGPGHATVQADVGYFRAMNPPKSLEDKAAKKKASSQESDVVPDTSSAELLNSYADNNTPRGTPRSSNPNSSRPRNNR